MVFTTSLLGTQKNRDSVENKPASLLVFLDKTLNGTPLSLCDRQVVGPSSLPVVVAPTRKPSVSVNAIYIHTSSYIMLTTKKIKISPNFLLRAYTNLDHCESFEPFTDYMCAADQDTAFWPILTPPEMLGGCAFYIMKTPAFNFLTLRCRNL